MLESCFESSLIASVMIIKKNYLNSKLEYGIKANYKLSTLDKRELLNN